MRPLFTRTGCFASTEDAKVKTKRPINATKIGEISRYKNSYQWIQYECISFIVGTVLNRLTARQDIGKFEYAPSGFEVCLPVLSQQYRLHGWFFYSKFCAVLPLSQVREVLN